MAIETIQVTEGSGPGVAVDVVDTDKRVQIVKIMHGADGALDGIVDDASPMPVSLSAAGYSASATFTPGASSHAAGDTNGAAAEFTSMGPSGGAIIIVSATLEIDNSSAEATAWRVQLYNVTPSSAIADSGVWDYTNADRSQYLGYIDLPSTATDLGSNQWVEVNSINKMVRLSGTSLFGYLVNLTTVTPGAVAHKVTLHAVAA